MNDVELFWNRVAQTFNPPLKEYSQLTHNERQMVLVGIQHILQVVIANKV